MRRKGVGEEAVTTWHRTSGRWRLGLLLALLTTGVWATLPIALKVALEVLDPWTLTWVRFLVAAVLMGAWLALRGRWRALTRLTWRGWALLMLAAATLIGNYVLYALGLHDTTPANVQVLIQLAPLLMALGGIIVFGERFRAGQWIGLGLIVAGLGLFFSDQLAATTGGRYTGGSLLVVLAAVAWAVYALAQKQLLVGLSSGAIMGAIYVVATLVLWPAAEPAQLARLDGFHLAAVAYCAFNTLGAYGAFAEALAHWEASRVSAVLAVTPVLTVVAMEVTVWVAPDLVAPERIALAGWVGAALVVGGSMLVSLLAARGESPGAAPRAARRPAG